MRPQQLISSPSPSSLRKALSQPTSPWQKANDLVKELETKLADIKNDDPAGPYAIIYDSILRLQLRAMSGVLTVPHDFSVVHESKRDTILTQPTVLETPTTFGNRELSLMSTSMNSTGKLQTQANENCAGQIQSLRLKPKSLGITQPSSTSQAVDTNSTQTLQAGEQYQSTQVHTSKRKFDDFATVDRRTTDSADRSGQGRRKSGVVFWCPHPRCRFESRQHNRTKQHIKDTGKHEGQTVSLVGRWSDGTEWKNTQEREVLLDAMIKRQKEGHGKEDFVVERLDQKVASPNWHTPEGSQDTPPGQSNWQGPAAPGGNSVCPLQPKRRVVHSNSHQASSMVRNTSTDAHFGVSVTPNQVTRSNYNSMLGGSVAAPTPNLFLPAPYQQPTTPSGWQQDWFPPFMFRHDPHQVPDWPS